MVTVASLLVIDQWKTSSVCIFSAVALTALLLRMVFVFSEMEKSQKGRKSKW